MELRDCRRGLYRLPSAYRTAFISDQSASPIVLHVTNIHTNLINTETTVFSGNAIDLTGSTFSGMKVFASPDFSIDGGGEVIASQLSVSGSGDNFVEVKTSGGVAADWYFQVVSADGRARIYDNASGLELLSFGKNGAPTVLPNNGYPGGGAANVGLMFGAATGFGIYFGTNPASVSAGKGSLYLCDNGSSSTTRAYINTDGGTTWTAIMTVG